MEFILEGGEGEERVQNETTFRYLGSPLDQTDDDWTAMRRNIMRARSVWGRLGTLLRYEGTEPRVAEMFYRAVVKAIILYELETWVLQSAIQRKVEGTHTGLLRQIKEKRARRLGDSTWETPEAEGVREAAGMQSEMNYIWRRQAIMAQWVALHLLFEVCARGKCYGWDGRRKEAWWRQEATEKQLWATTIGIQRVAKRRRIGEENVTQQEPEGRRRAGWEVGMMGQRHETPRWANDLVCQVYMLGRRRGTPRWADELMWQLRWGLEQQGGGVEYITISGRV